MSETPATPAAPAKPLTAIQVIEHELSGFFKQLEMATKQAEQVVANQHAVQGAIQAAQHLLGKLKAEAAKAEAFAVQEVNKAENEAKKVVEVVEAEAKKL